MPAAQVATLCPASVPAERVPCPSCEFCDDITQHQACSNNGRCAPLQHSACFPCLQMFVLWVLSEQRAAVPGTPQLVVAEACVHRMLAHCQ